MQKLIWLNLCWAAKSFVYSEFEKKMTEGYFSVQGHIQGYFPENRPKMLMTDVGDEMYRWQFEDVGDGLKLFWPETMSPRSWLCHQH